MIYQALLLSAIGTDQDHFPVVLAAADSTLEGMLSLNVNVIEEGADDSSSLPGKNSTRKTASFVPSLDETADRRSDWAVY